MSVTFGRLKSDVSNGQGKLKRKRAVGASPPFLEITPVARQIVKRLPPENLSSLVEGGEQTVLIDYQPPVLPQPTLTVIPTISPDTEGLPTNGDSGGDLQQLEDLDKRRFIPIYDDEMHATELSQFGLPLISNGTVEGFVHEQAQAPVPAPIHNNGVVPSDVLTKGITSFGLPTIPPWVWIALAGGAFFLFKGKRKKTFSGVAGFGWVPVLVAALGVIGTVGGGYLGYKITQEQRGAMEAQAAAVAYQSQMQAMEAEKSRASQQKLLLYGLIGGAVLLLILKRK